MPPGDEQNIRVNLDLTPVSRALNRGTTEWKAILREVRALASEDLKIRSQIILDVDQSALDADPLGRAGAAGIFREAGNRASDARSAAFRGGASETGATIAANKALDDFVLSLGGTSASQIELNNKLREYTDALQTQSILSREGVIQSEANAAVAAALFEAEERLIVAKARLENVTLREALAAEALANAEEALFLARDPQLQAALRAVAVENALNGALEGLAVAQDVRVTGAQQALAVESALLSAQERLAIAQDGRVAGVNQALALENARLAAEERWLLSIDTYTQQIIKGAAVQEAKNSADVQLALLKDNELQESLRTNAVLKARRSGEEQLAVLRDVEVQNRAEDIAIETAQRQTRQAAFVALLNLDEQEIAIKAQTNIDKLNANLREKTQVQRQLANQEGLVDTLTLEVASHNELLRFNRLQVLEAAKVLELTEAEANAIAARLVGQPLGAAGLGTPPPPPGGAAGAAAAGGGRFLRSAGIAVGLVGLFGTARAIGAIVEEAEELRQVNVRLEAQFENLAQLGSFDTLITSTNEAGAALRSLAGQAVLGSFRSEIEEIAVATGVTTDAVLKLSASFVGLFESLGSEGVAVSAFAEQATEITSQFSVITGLEPEEAFNDLVGAARSFSESGPDMIKVLNQLTNGLISVSDVTGVSAKELADFVGRIAPIARAAGFELQELNAIGATLLQGSGIGGAALAEQFGRIVTSFGGDLQSELVKFATQIPKLGINLQDLFSGDTAAVFNSLLTNFDKLNEAQQQNIITTIAGEREGNTLATVLQNLSTFQQGFAAQTEEGTQRLDRFAEVSETLTVKFNQFKVEVEQAGQALLEAGLEEALIAILDAVVALGRALGPLQEFFTLLAEGIKVASAGFSVLGITSESTAATIRAILDPLGTLQSGFTALANPLDAAKQLFGSFNFGPFDNGPSAIDAINKALLEQGDAFAVAVKAGEDYIEIQKDIGNLEEGVDLSGLETPTSVQGSFLQAEFKDKGVLEDVARINRLLGISIEDLTNAALASGPALEAFETQLRNLSSFEGLGPSGIGDVDNSAAFNDFIDSILDGTEDVPEIVKRLSQLIRVGKLTQEAALTILEVQTDFGDVELERLATEAEKAEKTLEGIVAAAGTGEDTRRAIQAAIAEANTKDGIQRDLAIQQILSNWLNETLVGTDVGDRNLEVQQAFVDLETLKGQLEAGLVSTEAFNQQASILIGGFQEAISAAIATGAVGALVENTQGLQEVQELVDQEVNGRFEILTEAAEILGRPLEGQGFVNALRSQLTQLIGGGGSPEAIREVANQLIDAEVEVFLEMLVREQGVNAALEALDSFNLGDVISDVARRGLIGAQLRDTRQRVDVFEDLGLVDATEDVIDDAFTFVENAILEGNTYEEAVSLFLAQRRAQLTELIGRLAIDAPGAATNLIPQLDAVELAIGNGPSATIADPGVAGIDTRTDEIEDLTKSGEEQYQQILDAYDRRADLLEAIGQNTPGDEAARAFQRLNDPDLSGADQLDAAIELAAALDEIAALEGEAQQIALERLGILVSFEEADIAANGAILRALIDEAENVFHQFVVQSLASVGDSLGAILDGTALAVAAGASFAEGLAATLRSFAATLRIQVQALGSAFDFGGDTGDIGILLDQVQPLADKIREFESLADAIDQGLFVPSGANFSPAGRGTRGRSGGGGGGGDDAADTARELAEAQIDLIRAQIEDNERLLAEFDVEFAQEVLAEAETEIDKLRAQAQLIRAERTLADVLGGIEDAKVDLVTAYLESIGDFEGALSLDTARQLERLQELFERDLGELGSGTVFEASFGTSGDRIIETFLNDQLAALTALGDVNIAELSRDQIDQLIGAIADLANSPDVNADTLSQAASAIQLLDSLKDNQIQDDIEDLDFLFNIDQLTREGLIAGLEGILATLDPVVDQEQFRDLSVRLHRLREEADGAQNILFNLPSGDFLPSLFEARRLDQFGPGGLAAVPSQRPSLDALRAEELIQSIDNRVVNIQVLVTDSGPSWEEALDSVQQAAGNPRTFSADVRRY